MPKASDLTLVCDKYLGVPYSQMDCQAFVEQCLSDIGIKKDLPGSNAWFRTMTWTGSPEECTAKFGKIPPGAFLFILLHDGKEPAQYKPDGIGNASHIGLYTGRGKGAIASSASRGCVCESEFHGKTIPNGGWNRVGLWNQLSYGELIDKILNGGGGTVKKAIVFAENGKPVNLRAQPSKASTVLIQVPVNAEIDLLEEGAEWSKVKFEEITGYMMTEFLIPVADDTPPENDPGDLPPADDGSVPIPMDLAVALWEALDSVIGHG